ncbi:juvenile hormone acid O-methyltransferase-like [Stomoxys calcitrans]|uniref:juvenile hormone acid O-methyltransferase-like n=1 Tax=Stomoxys calcitrans TaxID=35570 RepID=UPI0027E21D6D|nr:juvenile hormone acid O-methyltransferase-like [Stomoxys calcitrans]
MNHPELYHRANCAQRRDVELIIKKYLSKMQWHHNGAVSLIDMGTGSGDVLMDFVYPHMGKSLQRLVCSDISPKMLSYARKHVVNLNMVEFRILDMGTEQPLPNDLAGQFDYVTSFFAFMYVKSQRQALKNIHDLLKPAGGKCLILSLGKHPLFSAYIALSKMQKWSKYMTDVYSFVAPQHYCLDPRDDIINFMIEIGFSDYHVEIEHKVFDFESVETFKNVIVSINPFLDFMQDFLTAAFTDMNLKMKPMDHTGPLSISYFNLVIFGSRS